MEVRPVLLNKRMHIFSVFRLDIAVTYRCNSKCTFCNIWKIYLNNPEAVKNEMKLEDFTRLFKEVKLFWLHLTGGEPFIREDFKKIVYFGSKYTKPFLIDIATNGLLTKKIYEDTLWLTKKIKNKLEIGISLDGTRSVYKAVRGVDGFLKAVNTYWKLKKIKKWNFSVHFNYIINPVNLGKIKQFVEEIIKLGIDPSDVSVDVARNAYIFHNFSKNVKVDKQKLLKDIYFAIKLYKKKNIRNFLRKAYLKKMIVWIKKRKRIPCYSGYYHYFIDPYGNLRPCQQIPISFGNIKNGFWKVVNSKKAIEWRKQNSDCKKCWTGCEGVTSLLFTFPFKV